MKTKQIIALAIASLAVSAALLLPVNVYAADNCDAAILDCEKGIEGILELGLAIATTGLVGLAIAGVAYGIILYTTAGGSDGIKKAKTVFINIAIGIILFGAMAAVLAWLGIDPNDTVVDTSPDSSNTGGGLDGAGSTTPPKAPPGRVIPY